ncbi:hypothetical protein EST38_g10512 [Candolleomyces aberdarensis]|uniref:SAGA-associated factor 11 n=1 Tax=Candolleomyces aberdarensis TaxID=2316362 RepID=A0A4Q2D7W5_9AGAR|nr:hypothetical protein EST38_g10512 [Candolleomyces aberdarensis]
MKLTNFIPLAMLHTVLLINNVAAARKSHSDESVGRELALDDPFEARSEAVADILNDITTRELLEELEDRLSRRTRPGNLIKCARCGGLYAPRDYQNHVQSCTGPSNTRASGGRKGSN